MLIRRSSAYVTLVSVAALAACAAPARADDLPRTYFNEAKITVNERARADGYMRVRIQPENGEAREATIAMPKRMRENEIAKELADALKAVIGSDYKVDRDAGEHVKIKKAQRSAPDFSVEITFNAPGFAIILDH